MEHREAPFLGGVDHESIWIEPLTAPTLRGTLKRVLEPNIICRLDSAAGRRTDPFSLLPQSVPDHRCTHLVYAAATIGKTFPRRISPTGGRIPGIAKNLFADRRELTIVPRDPEYDRIQGWYIVLSSSSRESLKNTKLVINFNFGNKIDKNDYINIIIYTHTHTIILLYNNTFYIIYNDDSLFLLVLFSTAGGYNAATGLRSRDPALRVLISIAPPRRLLVEIARQGCSLHCDRLALSLLKFLEEYRFDGVEIDWSDAAERWSDFKLVLKTIGAPLIRAGYTLTLSMGAGDPVDREVASIADLIILRNWRNALNDGQEKLTALHPAPLQFFSRVTEKWIERIGVEQMSKIILSIPIFGQSYTLKYSNYTDVGASVVGPGVEGPYTKWKDGRLAYYEVRERRLLVLGCCSL